MYLSRHKAVAYKTARFCILLIVCVLCILCLSDGRFTSTSTIYSDISATSFLSVFHGSLKTVSVYCLHVDLCWYSWNGHLTRNGQLLNTQKSIDT